jgi:hypothetical protein
MAATDNFLKAGAALHNHDTKAAGIRIEFLLIQNHADRKSPFLSAQCRANLRHHILFGQLVIATDEFFESIPAGHDFYHQPTAVGMAFLLVKNVALFEWHGTPYKECSPVSFQRSVTSLGTRLFNLDAENEPLTDEPLFKGRGNTPTLVYRLEYHKACQKEYGHR